MWMEELMPSAEIVKAYCPPSAFGYWTAMPYTGDAGGVVLQAILDHTMSGMSVESHVDKVSGELVRVFKADNNVMDYRLSWWRSPLGRPTRNRIRLVLFITSVSRIWRGDNFVVI